MTNPSFHKRRGPGDPHDRPCPVSARMSCWVWPRSARRPAILRDFCEPTVGRADSDFSSGLRGVVRTGAPFYRACSCSTRRGGACCFEAALAFDFPSFASRIRFSVAFTSQFIHGCWTALGAMFLPVRGHRTSSAEMASGVNQHCGGNEVIPARMIDSVKSWGWVDHQKLQRAAGLLSSAIESRMR